MLAQYYYDVYLFFILIITLFCYNRYFAIDGEVREDGSLGFYLPQKETLAFILMLFMVLFIGTRPISGRFFGDMSSYYMEYKIYEGKDFSFDASLPDFLWTNLMHWWASLRLGFNSLMVLVACLYFGGTYKAVCRIFPNDKLAAYLIFLGAFSTFSYGTNGMRAGVAASVFLLALSYAGNWIVTIPLAFVTLYIHHSMVMPIFAMFAALAYRKTNVYLGIWLVCVFISALHITWFQDFFSQLSAGSGDKSGAEYLEVSSSSGWRTGFRLDFILYSAMPVVVSYYTVLKKKIYSEYYSFLVNIYLITNSMWLLCMYANFTNRIAYLSWFMYPVVLIYPFLNDDWGQNRYRIFAIIMLLNLGFTLAMQYIYYL